MQVKDYVSSILEVIASCPFVEAQTLAFEERPPDAAFLFGTIRFSDSSKLHFKEFVLLASEGVTVLKYGYNYLTDDGTLIFRYDNAYDPKAKKLPTYPEHKHISNDLISVKRPELKELLKEISGFFLDSAETLD